MLKIVDQWWTDIRIYIEGTTVNLHYPMLFHYFAISAFHTLLLTGFMVFSMLHNIDRSCYHYLMSLFCLQDGVPCRGAS